MAMITDVQVRIVPRVSGEGHPFTEILYDYQHDGQPRKALTRLWYVVPDGPHARAAQRQAFIERRSKFG